MADGVDKVTRFSSELVDAAAVEGERSTARPASSSGTGPGWVARCLTRGRSPGGVSMQLSPAGYL